MVMEFGLLRDRIVGADSRFSGELRGDALENVGQSSKNVSKESKDHSEMCFFLRFRFLFTVLPQFVVEKGENRVVREIFLDDPKWFGKSPGLFRLGIYENGGWEY